MLKNYTLDEDGEIWYADSRGQRRRGRWATCPQCGEAFPAERRRVYCSNSCSGKAGRPPGGNQQVFSTWSAEEAWLAGLIWADGSLVRPGKRALSPYVKVGSVDREITDEAARILGVRVSTYAPPAPRKPFHTVRVSGKPVDRLIAAGLGHDKTMSGGLPDLARGLHAAAFMRGLFDGDGSVGLYVNPSKVSQEPRLKSHLVGTPEAMHDAREVLVARAGVRRNKVCSHSGSRLVAQLFFNHADSLRLAEFIYSEPGPFLARKRDLFDEGRRICPVI